MTGGWRKTRSMARKPIQSQQQGLRLREAAERANRTARLPAGTARLAREILHQNNQRSLIRPLLMTIRRRINRRAPVSRRRQAQARQAEAMLGTRAVHRAAVLEIADPRGRAQAIVPITHSVLATLVNVDRWVPRAARGLAESDQTIRPGLAAPESAGVRRVRASRGPESGPRSLRQRGLSALVDLVVAILLTLRPLRPRSSRQTLPVPETSQERSSLTRRKIRWREATPPGPADLKTPSSFPTGPGHRQILGRSRNSPQTREAEPLNEEERPNPEGERQNREEDRLNGHQAARRRPNVPVISPGPQRLLHTFPEVTIAAAARKSPTLDARAMPLIDTHSNFCNLVPYM